MEPFIGLAIAIGLFFIFRFVMLWYWRVDTIVKNQEETIKQLILINNKLSKANKANTNNKENQ